MNGFEVASKTRQQSNSEHAARAVQHSNVERAAFNGPLLTQFNFSKIPIQSKMRISEPGDVYEQEADWIAEQVMSVQSPSEYSVRPSSFTDGRVSRKCAECDMKKEEEKEENALMISRKSSATAPDLVSSDVAHEIQTGRESGLPLDRPTKEFMEGEFRHDFSDVRIHSDDRAAHSAQALNALAYTVGQDIFFDAGQYQPHSDSGRRLLAHELTHTIQQQGVQRFSSQNSSIQNPEYQRLEQEADHASDAVTQGQSLQHGAFSRSAARLSLKERDEQQDHKVKSRTRKGKKIIEMETGHKVELEKAGTSGQMASFKVDKIVLHPSKGDVVNDWKKKAGARALRAIITMEGTTAKRAGLWQLRADTDELRALWLNMRGLEKGAALDAAWKDAGGDAEFPKIDGVACQMDHIIELQVNGDNTMENIQLLDPDENRASGNLLWQQVSGLAASIAEKMNEDQEEGDKLPKEIRMIFENVEMTDKPTCASCCKVAEKLKAPKGGVAPAKSMSSYHIGAGGALRTLLVPAKSGKKDDEVDILESELPHNVSTASMIPGLLLLTLNRKSRGKDSVAAKIDDREKTRLPVTLEKKRGNEVPLSVEENRELKLSNPDKDIAFIYDYLSPGKFTKLEQVPGGLAGEGYITPTKVPFLKKIDVAFSPEFFRLKAPINKDNLRPPFSGVEITEASLAIELAPKLKPVGTIAFDFGRAKKLASSKVEVSADEGGIVLDGSLQVFLPGVDDARGNIKYQGGKWSGGAHIESSQIKLPYVKSGSLDVFLAEGKIDATGKLNLELPGKNEASVELEYFRNKWIFKGRGTFKVNNPYLKSIHANLFYDGELFKAEGKAGFTFAGLDGDIDATYEKKDGQERVYGKGNLKINKGRAKGDIAIELHPNQKITGKGRLSYEIKKDMIATASITVDEHQKIIFDGELSLPNIELFKRFPASREKRPIFGVSTRIPVPGLNFAGVGVYVKIEASLYYYYYVGPGILREIKASVRFSPFEEDPDFSFKLRAVASIPAGGGLTGELGAGLALDVFIAEVGGKISVSATAGLEGKAELGGEIAYSKDRFSVDASAYIGGKVILLAGLNATLYAEAGVWRFKVRTEKTWELANYSFDTGLQLGIRMPLHYDSIDGFRMPSLSDIKPEPATLDISPSNMLSSLFANAPSKERET